MTTDTIDLDLRARTAALPEATRRSVWAETDPLWREALLVESRGLVRLRGGRLLDGDDWHRVRQVLRDRSLRARGALIGPNGRDYDELGHVSLSGHIYFVDGRVPMATLWEVQLGIEGVFSLALRGPHGVTLLPSRYGFCGEFPHDPCEQCSSVEVEVSATRFLLRSSELGDCTHRSRELGPWEIVIAREGPDRGAGLLRDALAASPWVLAAAPRAADGRLMHRSDPGPWGYIRIQVDEELTVSDFVATVMAVRERSPGSCRLPTHPEGCLFPYFLPSIARGSAPPPR